MSVGHLDVASKMCAREAQKLRSVHIYASLLDINIFVVDKLRIFRNLVNEEL